MSPEKPPQRSTPDQCLDLIQKIESIGSIERVRNDVILQKEVYEFVYEQFIRLRDQTPDFEFDHSLLCLTVDYLQPFEQAELPHIISPWHMLRSIKPSLDLHP